MKYLETDRRFYEALVKLALPVALQSVITVGINLIDTIMLGELGETALSASSLANQFISLFMFLCMGIAMGTSVMTSRFWGARDHESLKKVITIALRFGGALALLFTALNVLFPRTIMTVYTAEAEVIEAGIVYLVWSTPAYLLVALTLICTNILRSTELQKVPFLASIFGFFINIGANYVFIFGKLGMPAMGVAGAALGTVIARVVEAGIILVYFLLKDEQILYRVKDLFSRCGEMFPEFARISVPVMLSDGLLGIGESVLAIIMGHISSQFVSANAITNVVQRISTIFISGISFGSCFILGQTLGRGETEKAQRQGNTCFALGLGIGVLAAGIIELIASPVIRSYNITEETQLIARALMHAISVIVVFRSTNSILTKGVLRGGGDTRFLVYADTSTMWLLAIPLGALCGLVLRLSPFWIYLALHADQVVKAVWCYFRLKSGKWIKKIRSSSEVLSEKGKAVRA